mmetsp:Transcript_50670/g.132900  ORF Transcript_50670/g.132900 Transcript_50670/m.132900 type:complete len:126 (-) Transcript_50670:172-549(-)
MRLAVFIRSNAAGCIPGLLTKCVYYSSCSSVQHVSRYFLLVLSDAWESSSSQRGGAERPPPVRAAAPLWAASILPGQQALRRHAREGSSAARVRKGMAAARATSSSSRAVSSPAASSAWRPVLQR